MNFYAVDSWFPSHDKSGAGDCGCGCGGGAVGFGDVVGVGSELGAGAVGAAGAWWLVGWRFGNLFNVTLAIVLLGIYVITRFA